MEDPVLGKRDLPDDQDPVESGSDSESKSEGSLSTKTKEK